MEVKIMKPKMVRPILITDHDIFNSDQFIAPQLGQGVIPEFLDGDSDSLRGCPQRGQDTALFDTCLSQAGQFIKAREG